MEIALSKSCGDADIITPISAEDEIVRRNLGETPGPQNYLAPLYDYSWKEVARLAFWQKKKLRYYNHITAANVKKNVGEKVWNEYFKFCFERNPWDRVISLYYWRHNVEPRPTFSEFLDSGAIDILKRRGYYSYTLDGKVVVDKICRFENISEELEGIRSHLGIHEKLAIPRAKSKFRKDKRSYQEIIDCKQRDRIAEMFQEEINLMGYEF